MGKYANRYISREDFENLCLANRLYEGYVVGVGYAYCEAHVITPTHLHGNGSSAVWGNRPTSYTHNIIATNQCIDCSPYAVFRSLRLTVDDFAKVLVNQTIKGTNVNMGNGREFFISAGANHKIDIEIRDNGNEIGIRIKVENLDTKESCETMCLMNDFPFIFNTYPAIPSSIQDNPDKGVGQPGLWESMIPIWGSGRAAVDHFQSGNYWRGALYTVLAISDVFLVKSIFTGLAKGAFKIAGSHTWGATRQWMLKKGWAEPGKPLHHWAIQNATGKKYGIEAIANQPWNLLQYSDDAAHITIGHGRNYLNVEAADAFTRFWYGNPNWFKAAGTSTVGRGVMLPSDGAYSNYEQQQNSIP